MNTADSPSITPHHFFSPSRVWALSVNTLTDLSRQKIFYFFLIFALGLIGFSIYLQKFSFGAEFQMLKDVGLGAMSIFTTLIAILATAYLLPKDVEDRTLYTILAKPVPRFEYLLGKLLGVLMLLFISLVIMSALFILILTIRERMVISDAVSQSQGLSSEDLTAFIAQTKASALNINLLPGILTIFIKAALLAALTLFVSTFASSGIFTVLVVIAVFFIGHLQSTAREYWLASADLTWITRIFLAIIALLFPDLQAFNLIDAVVVSKPVGMDVFLQILGLGFLYVAVYYLLAVFLFSNKEL